MNKLDHFLFYDDKMEIIDGHSNESVENSKKKYLKLWYDGTFDVFDLKKNIGKGKEIIATFLFDVDNNFIEKTDREHRAGVLTFYRDGTYQYLNDFLRWVNPNDKNDYYYATIKEHNEKKDNFVKETLGDKFTRLTGKAYINGMSYQGCLFYYRDKGEL